METIILYILFTGCIYASWLYDISDKWWINAMNIVFGLMNGWYVAPILIGRVIRQFYKD
jgi:hypothetical protein